MCTTQTNQSNSNPEINGGGGWGIFNALFGWQNSATYGSVISYNLYWIFVIAGFAYLRWRERRGAKQPTGIEAGDATHRKDSGSDNTSSDGVVVEKSVAESKRAVPEVSAA